MDVDVWVRGTNRARTEALRGVPENPLAWTDADVRTLLTEMLWRSSGCATQVEKHRS